MLKRCCRSAEEEGEKLLPSGDPEEYAEDWEAGDSEDFEFDVGGGGQILPTGASRKTTEKRILGIFSLHERSFHCSLEISAFCFQSVSHEKESRVCGRLSGSACQSCKHAVVNNKSVRKHLLRRFEAHSTLFGTSLCHEMDLTSLVGSNFDYCIL